MPPVRAAHVDDLADGDCLPVVDGRVLLVRDDGRIVAFDNRCLHTAAPLDGATVRDGVLMCPRHFWRYRVDDGTLRSGGVGALPTYDVTVEPDGAVIVDVPPPPSGSLRERLLEHARTWERGG